MAKSLHRYPFVLLPVILGALTGLVLLWGLLLWWAPAVHARSNAMAAQGGLTCTTVNTVTHTECLALLALYSATNGTQWITQTNWGQQSPNAPCDWYGVTCEAGHVRQLLLAGNRLSGTLPLPVGQLAALTSLRLENNALRGRVPPTLCRLTPTLTELSLAYNALFSGLKRVQQCLTALEPQWLDSQTLPVRNLAVTEFFTDSLRLTWSTSGYPQGYVEIYAATRPDGPYTLHGVTADKSTNSYLVTGLTPGTSYFFRVNTFTPAHDDQPNALRSVGNFAAGVTKATSGNVVVAAYFPADNDLASQIGYVTNRLRLGTLRNPNVKVLLLVDGAGTADTRLIVIANGALSNTSVVVDVWGTGELDTADPMVLAWFLQYVRENYRATRTVVSLIGHGLALAPEVAWPTTRSTTAATATAHHVAPRGEIPALPRDWTDMPNDITNNSYMSTTDVGQALLAATGNGANPFDLVFFDQCFQGNLDALYEVRQSAKVFVASPNYAWLAAAYDKYLLGFTPAATPEEMAEMIINRYQGTLDRRHPNAIFWVRGSDITAIAAQVNNLGDALSAALRDGQNEKISASVRQSKYVDTTQCGKRVLQLGPPDELIGLETFGQQLLLNFGLNDPYGVATALDGLRTAMSNMRKISRTGAPYIAPAEFWDYRDSLTVLTPLPRNSPSGVAWRASIYRADAPFTATWTLDPTQPVTVTESLAYAREGRWDDFLARWYQNLTPTVGQWCNYIPPEQVVVDEADPLTLTVGLSDTNAITLDWTATDDDAATSYWLYRDAPDRVSWTAVASVPITQQATTVGGLVAGDYRFQLFARNAEDEFVAQSNALTVTIASTPTPLRLFLPLVSR